MAHHFGSGPQRWTGTFGPSSPANGTDSAAWDGVPTNLRAPDLHSCSTTRSVAVFPPAQEAEPRRRTSERHSDRRFWPVHASSDIASRSMLPSWKAAPPGAKKTAYGSEASLNSLLRWFLFSTPPQSRPPGALGAAAHQGRRLSTPTDLAAAATAWARWHDARAVVADAPAPCPITERVCLWCG
jgi:hypothetical protein